MTVLVWVLKRTISLRYLSNQRVYIVWKMRKINFNCVLLSLGLTFTQRREGIILLLYWLKHRDMCHTLFTAWRQPPLVSLIAQIFCSKYNYLLEACRVVWVYSLSFPWGIIFEPVHEISNNVVCGTSKASDQPAHTRSLIRAFASRLSILWLLSYWLNTIWSF